MIRVKDNAGTILNGISRDPAGSLVVTDSVAYHQHKTETQLREDVSNLKTEMADIKDKLEQIIKYLK